MSANVTFLETKRLYDNVDSPSENIPLPSLVESCDTDVVDSTTIKKKTPRPLQVYH